MKVYCHLVSACTVVQGKLIRADLETSDSSALSRTLRLGAQRLAVAIDLRSLSRPGQLLGLVLAI